MKKVHVVSKTHLDLGFTDFGENIRRKYIEEFIPSAISLAEKVNAPDEKKFIWTTGSWILKEALSDSDETRKNNLIKALKDGNIVPHGLPFTTHSELFDEDTFDYGLSIVEELDEIREKKTVAAKMTDVPGHTVSLVPILAKHGIKLLHIGVNGFSAVPKVPECFLWKNGESEIVVIYSGGYGGAFKSEYIDDVLYIDHTVDNRGAPSAEKVDEKLNKLKKEYPGYDVCASTLDDYAEALWTVRNKLPVIENEIGDTWIHGAASDPFKTASLRELMALKIGWLEDGSMKKGGEEYNNFSDALLCLGEHTWGVDSKIYLGDYENYLKHDFERAYKADKVEVKHPLRDFPKGFIYRAVGKGAERRYSVMEKSWNEKREYINKAVNSLGQERKTAAVSVLKSLRPEKKEDVSSLEKFRGKAEFKLSSFELNEFGGISGLNIGGRQLFRINNRPVFEYRSYSSEDYDFFFSHYARNKKENGVWGYPDFGKPLLEKVDKKYPTGRFFYKMTRANIYKDKDFVKVYAELETEKILSESLGAPRSVQIIYTLSKNNLLINVSWFDKDANRSPEALFVHFYPKCEDVELQKTGKNINYKSTVFDGGRNLHAVEKLKAIRGDFSFDIINSDSPLISVGNGKILEFDNKIENPSSDGISYLLYDNIWGTNFPLWYRDNASFKFTVKI